MSDSFDEIVIPHLPVARRLARSLLRNEQDAEDAVQEASLRALRYFRTFTGGNGRAWFLRIVRNTCWAWRGRPMHATTDTFEEEQHSNAGATPDPEALMLHRDAAAVVGRAMDDLPDRQRRLLVLREFEGLSYREMADLMGVPMGTVMSGLSRARAAFRGAVHDTLKPPASRARTARNTRARPPIGQDRTACAAIPAVQA